MSKMDNLRAMREARYAEMAKRSPESTKPAASKTGAKSAPASKRPPVAPPAPVESDESSEPALCGHRNMSGRTCTREAGHAAKSHRYS